MELVFWQLKNSHYYKEYLKEVKIINYYLNTPRNSFTGKFVFPSRLEHYYIYKPVEKRFEPEVKVSSPALFIQNDKFIWFGYNGRSE